MKLTDFLVELDKLPAGTICNFSYTLRKVIYTSAGTLDGLSSDEENCNAMNIEHNTSQDVSVLKERLQKLADKKPNILVYIYDGERYVPDGLKMTATVKYSKEKLLDFMRSTTVKDDALVALVEKCNKEMKFSNDAFLDEVLKSVTNNPIIPLHFTFLDDRWYIGEPSSICPTEFSVPPEAMTKLLTKTAHGNVNLYRYRVQKDFLKIHFPANVINRMDDLLKEATIVDENGNITCTQGDIVTRYARTANGRLVKNGLTQYYATSANGKRYLSKEESYVLGCLNGVLRLFNEKGDVSEMMTYRDDILHGEHSYILTEGIYPAGTKVQAFYEKNSLHGEKTFTLPCGFVKRTEKYTLNHMDERVELEKDGSKVIWLYKDWANVAEKHYNSSGKLIKSLVCNPTKRIMVPDNDELVVTLSSGKMIRYQHVGERLVTMATLTEEEKQEVKASGYSYVE